MLEDARGCASVLENARKLVASDWWRVRGGYVTGATSATMSVETKHPEYEKALASWERARDMIGGEDAMKARRETYLPKLNNQTQADYDSYLGRACFYNATERTHESMLGLLFRQAGRMVMPAEGAPLGKVVRDFLRDVDLVGTTFDGLAREVCSEILAVGRCGVLVDWEGEWQKRVVTSSWTTPCRRGWMSRGTIGLMRKSLLLVSGSSPLTPSSRRALT